MLPRKRKRTVQAEDATSDDSGYLERPVSDDELDFSNVLVGRNAHAEVDETDDHDELNELIKKSLSRRAIHEGVQVVKNAKGKSKILKGELGGGSFQSMGLHPSLLRSLTLQGYRIPTPIQRLSIPALLASPPRDLVGMARTGSGKSLAFLIPLVQRFGGRHSQNFGARALILLPTRELALQVMKVGKELARGLHSGLGDHAGDKLDSELKKGQNLRWGLVVGGEGLDEQFEMITTNPDIIIATPGRLLHLIVEMNLDLKAVQYVVFDEADRLFEMGFETALTEILHRLPASRQTVLFSATLPKSLVEFAKAGLQDPKLVRLDAESKISSDLKMAFFLVKQGEKDACLLSLLRDAINVPLGESKSLDDSNAHDNKSKGKGNNRHEQFTAPHQTLIFAATKHHVEYLTNLLTTCGYAVSHIYGSLDQAARSFQMDQFRRGVTSILVVTDVAARGIDIPVLGNVVNFDFPQGARVFVHRVGRTARAGRQGWAWSFITASELPHLLDLQLFLGRPLRQEVTEVGDQAYMISIILGTFQREKTDEDVEYVKSLDEANHSLPTLREVMKRGHAMYERSKSKASPQSYKRAKEMTKDPTWMLAGSDSGIHPVLLRKHGSEKLRANEVARKKLLQTLNTFRPSETVFEVTSKGKTDGASLMRERRKALSKSAQRASVSTSAVVGDSSDKVVPGGFIEMADEEEIAAVFHTKKESFKDEEFYLSYQQKDAQTEKGYSLTDGASSFVKQAQGVTFDLAGDEGTADRRSRRLTWDKKQKKFVKGDGVGADNVKIVKTESGIKLPATYRSGRFDEWKAKSHIALPRTGEAENMYSANRKSTGPGGHRFKHQKVETPKPLDKLRLNYERKARRQRQREQGNDVESATGQKRGKVLPGGRNAGESYGRVKSELKTTEQIRKTRQLAAKKRAKNARPSRASKRGKR